MDDEEFFDLARLIRDHLLELGLNDIADFDHYFGDEDEGRPLPDGRTLVKLILRSFDRYLAANSTETVEESLRIITNSIDEGERPEWALVHVGDHPMHGISDREVPAEVMGLGRLAEMREALRELERRLFEDSDPTAPDGGVA